MHKVGWRGYATEPPAADASIDFYFVCDVCPRLETGTRWKTVPLNNTQAFLHAAACGAASRPKGVPGLSSGQCLSRVPKLLPQLYFGTEYTHTLFFDAARVIIVKDPIEVFAQLDNADADFATFAFPQRLEDEAAEVKSYLTKLCGLNEVEERALEPALHPILAKYAGAQHAEQEPWRHLENHTMYGKVLLRRTGSRSENFNNLWWHEFTTGMPRDQFAMKWCVWKVSEDTAASVANGTAPKGERPFRWVSLGDEGRENPLWQDGWRASLWPFDKMTGDAVFQHHGTDDRAQAKEDCLIDGELRHHPRGAQEQVQGQGHSADMLALSMR